MINSAINNSAYSYPVFSAPVASKHKGFNTYRCLPVDEAKAIHLIKKGTVVNSIMTSTFLCIELWYKGRFYTLLEYDNSADQKYTLTVSYIS